jgi:hypothetical protein
LKSLYKQYSPFYEAKDIVRKLELTTRSRWFKYARFGKLPSNVSMAPHYAYGNDWVDSGDWLGTGRKATQEKGWSINKLRAITISNSKWDNLYVN